MSVPVLHFMYAFKNTFVFLTKTSLSKRRGVSCIRVLSSVDEYIFLVLHCMFFSSEFKAGTFYIV